MQNLKVILFVVNTPEFFISHRLPLAIEAKASGYDVHIATANGDCVDDIVSMGFTHHLVQLSRSGQNPLVEMTAVLKLFGLMRRIQPDLIHLVTIKPVLYGGIAARLAGVKSVVAAVSGLGTVFLTKSRFGRLRKWLVTRLYGMAFKQQQLAVIFQNPDDRDTLLQARVLSAVQARIIRGSGVALADYPFCTEPEGRLVVVMAARLLRDKGVVEFVDAARLLKLRGLDVDMRLIGSPDPGNATTVTSEELARWAEEGCVNLLGFRNDIAVQYAAANIVCLPSYYGEGLPKCLVEAAACGRAVVTTDHPGCRDAIIPGVTGLLVPVRDSFALADAIQIMIKDPCLPKQMGRAGRALAEDVFSIEKIVEQHMDIYRELLES